jgi:hypothetical protein
MYNFLLMYLTTRERISCRLTPDSDKCVTYDKEQVQGFKLPCPHYLLTSLLLYALYTEWPRRYVQSFLGFHGSEIKLYCFV